MVLLHRVTRTITRLVDLLQVSSLQLHHFSLLLFEGREKIYFAKLERFKKKKKTFLSDENFHQDNSK